MNSLGYIDYTYLYNERALVKSNENFVGQVKWKSLLAPKCYKI